jgi:hypothetical protein
MLYSNFWSQFHVSLDTLFNLFNSSSGIVACKVDLTSIGWEGMDWIHLAQDGSSGGLLWPRLRNCMFRKKEGISWLTRVE